MCGISISKVILDALLEQIERKKRGNTRKKNIKRRVSLNALQIEGCIRLGWVFSLNAIRLVRLHRMENEKWLDNEMKGHTLN